MRKDEEEKMRGPKS